MQSDRPGRETYRYSSGNQNWNDWFCLDELAKALLSRGTWSHTHMHKETGISSVRKNSQIRENAHFSKMWTPGQRYRLWIFGTELVRHLGLIYYIELNWLPGI